MEFISNAKAATALLRLNAMDATIPSDTSEIETHKLPLTFLAPLNMIVPLLTPPLISPTDFYALFNTIAASLKLTEAFQSLLNWLSRGLK